MKRKIIQYALGAIYCALLLLGVIPTCGAQLAELPAALRDKMDGLTWRRVSIGEPRDLLVLFADPAIDLEIRQHLATQRLSIEDSAALNLRAERYRQLKATSLSTLPRDGAEVRRDYRHIPMALIRFKTAIALLNLIARKEVLAIAEDITLYPVLTQSLPLVGQVPVAQVMGRTGAGTTIVVLDSGIDYTRSEFGNCTAPGMPSGCRVVVAMEMAPNDNSLDDIGHGTQVAATVTATSPGARLAVLDVFSGPGASSSDIIGGIDWAIANQAAYNIVAINMSLGSGTRNTSPCANFFQNPFRQPIIDALHAGILSVIASGNDGFADGLSNPACTPEAISVGAVYDSNVGPVGYAMCSDAASVADQVTCFSNSASFLTLLAPGALITTAGVTTAGTSFSAPFVSSAVAVLAAAFPLDTPSQRLARLTSSGKPVLDTRNMVTKPRLDLLAAQGAPPNNAFAAAASLPGSTGQATGWNFNATSESGEPVHAGVTGGKSVWWQWTATQSGILFLDTHGSAFNTLLAAYTGLSPNTLSLVAGNDDDNTSSTTSGLAFHANAGVSYRLVVDGNAGATGAIILNYAFTADQPQSADLSIVLQDAPDPVNADGILSYTITVTNAGPAVAQNIVALLTLAPGVRVVSATGCTIGLGVVTCNMGSLSASLQATRNIQVLPIPSGAIQAQVTVGASTADSNVANNTATTSTEVKATPGESGEVPLPLWAEVMLGAALWRVMQRRL